MPFISK